LKNLETLDLNANQLTDLPQENKECKNLETLWLIGNNFSQIEKEKIKQELPNTAIYR